MSCQTVQLRLRLVLPGRHSVQGDLGVVHLLLDGVAFGPSDLALDLPGLVTLEPALEVFPRAHVVVDYHQENGYGQHDAPDGEYLVEVSNVVVPIGFVDSHSIAPVVRC